MFWPFFLLGIDLRRSGLQLEACPVVCGARLLARPSSQACLAKSAWNISHLCRQAEITVEGIAWGTSMKAVQTLLEKLNAIERGQELLCQQQRKAVELLNRLVGRENARDEADGPIPPCTFRLGGVVYEVSPAQWRLLNFLWNRKPVRIEDVMEAIYGINYTKPDSALFSLCNRLNWELADQNCPASVHRRSGYLFLDLPAVE
jgi:hypothetical protein